MKGTIPGRGKIEIDIDYRPIRPETVIVEVELKVAQYGFEPIIISITGSGQYPQIANLLKEKEQAQLQKAKEEKEQRKKNNAFRLTNVRGKSRSQILRDKNIPLKRKQSLKIEGGELTKDIGDEVKIRPSSVGNQKMGKIELEKAFLARFENIVKLCKDKEIKMFRCVGDPQPTEEDTDNILKNRSSFMDETMDTLRLDGIQRYSKVLDHDLPILEPVLPTYPPTWDMSKNNATKLRKMRLTKFMNAATKIVLRSRVEKRLSMFILMKIRLESFLVQLQVEKMW